MSRPAPTIDASIRDAIEAAPEVRRVIHLRTLQLGPDELLVATKVDIDAADVAGVATAIDAIEVRIRAAVPIARRIYVEPDLYRTDGSERVPPAGDTVPE